ncbi:MAG TPA: periplasmic heavy metal sensor [Candidatus Eisenbacteria bacterium]|nr:periplasmic heavy metal sensor [Candidatus Eisenbacteria bacterium]
MFERSRLAALAAACLTLASFAPAFAADPADEPRPGERGSQWSDQDSRDHDSDSRWSDRPGYGRGGAQGRGQGMMRMLNLSAEQQERMRAIRERHSQRLTTLRDQLKDARADLEQRASDNEGRRLDSQIDRIADLQARLTRERLTMMLEMNRVLTPEQREKLRAAHERMQQRMEQRQNDRRQNRNRNRDRNRDDRGDRDQEDSGQN